MRTYLIVPRDAIEYAIRYGAILDKTRYQLYVEGEVPHELMNFLERAPKPSAARLVAPNCPICGSGMDLIKETKSGAWFYGCSSYLTKGCRGTIGYEDHLRRRGISDDLTPIGVLTRKACESRPRDASTSKRLTESPDLVQAVKVIAELGVHVLGGRPALERWLDTPKRSLSGQKPLQVMRSLDGCFQVISLLRQLQQK